MVIPRLYTVSIKVALWLSSNGVGHINSYSTSSPVSTDMGDHSWDTITSRSDLLSLLPSAGRKMSTSQGAVAVLCSREGNRRPAVALAMRRGLLDVRAQWSKEGNRVYIP